MLLVFVVWKYRESQKPDLVTLQGTTMGTIGYTVKYLAKSSGNYQPEIDSILEDFNQSLNHYRPESEVSKFNRDSVFVFTSPYFYSVLKRSREVFEKSDGAFDPTISPLINAWGFGPGKKENPDSARIDSLRLIIYFHNIEFDTEKVWKKKKGIQLDFSAIAKGQGVDVIVEFLQSKGIENIFVEIGGEVRCTGKNDKGEEWIIGIVDPRTELTHTEMFGTVFLDNKSMATSGNYYNYFEQNGRRIVHTINPATGYPEISNLLSASVIANHCMTADAYATAFMVMGLEKSISMIENDETLDAILIYSKSDGSLDYYASDGIKNKFQLHAR
jgi:thiamine biosynthesis lipoprotein